MKKTYITLGTLFLILIALVLTSVSDVKENDTDYTIDNNKDIVYDENVGNMASISTSTETEVTARPVVLSNTKTWTWVKTIYNDGKIITPKNPDKFKLTFTDSKTFSATTDCNGVGGEYRRIKDSLISFDKMISTMMYCEGSQEQIFTKSLSEVVSVNITDKGELVFDLLYDSGSMIFR